MYKKAVLPKDVSSAIKGLLSDGYSEDRILVSVAQAVISDENLETLTNYAWEMPGKLSEDFSLLASALVNGYEVEATSEEQLREFYRDLISRAVSRDSHEHSAGENVFWKKARAVRETLDILGIKIEGINEKPDCSF